MATQIRPPDTQQFALPSSQLPTGSASGRERSRTWPLVLGSAVSFLGGALLIAFMYAVRYRSPEQSPFADYLGYLLVVGVGALSRMWLRSNWALAIIPAALAAGMLLVLGLHVLLNGGAGDIWNDMNPFVVIALIAGAGGLIGAYLGRNLPDASSLRGLDRQTLIPVSIGIGVGLSFGVLVYVAMGLLATFGPPALVEWAFVIGLASVFLGGFGGWLLLRRLALRGGRFLFLASLLGYLIAAVVVEALLQP